MSRKIITSVVEMDPSELLRIIESDPKAFTEGRRNNDLVNWFVAKRLVELEHTDSRTNNGRDSLRKCVEYESDFHYLIEAATAEQYTSILEWDTDPDEKIRRFHRGYGTMNAWAMSYLWLPMDYQSLVHEDQLQMLVTTYAPGKD
jgi:hypothetical protein